MRRQILAMWRLVIALQLAYCLCGPGLASALTDAEYEQLKQQSEAYSTADKQLSTAWQHARAIMDQDGLRNLLADQKKWLQTTRNIQADALTSGTGMSKAEAYATVTRERAARLDVYRQQIELDSRTTYTGSLTLLAEPSDANALGIIPDGQYAAIVIATGREYQTDQAFYSKMVELAKANTKVKITGKLESPERYDPRAKFKVSIVKSDQQPHNAAATGGQPDTNTEKGDGVPASTPPPSEDTSRLAPLPDPIQILQDNKAY